MSVSPRKRHLERPVRRFGRALRVAGDLHVCVERFVTKPQDGRLRLHLEVKSAAGARDVDGGGLLFAKLATVNQAMCSGCKLKLMLGVYGAPLASVDLSVGVGPKQQGDLSG